jgi:hypothetical protein
METNGIYGTMLFLSSFPPKSDSKSNDQQF